MLVYTWIKSQLLRIWIAYFIKITSWHICKNNSFKIHKEKSMCTYQTVIDRKIKNVYFLRKRQVVSIKFGLRTKIPVLINKYVYSSVVMFSWLLLSRVRTPKPFKSFDRVNSFWFSSSSSIFLRREKVHTTTKNSLVNQPPISCAAQERAKPSDHFNSLNWSHRGEDISVNANPRCPSTPSSPRQRPRLDADF